MLTEETMYITEYTEWQRPLSGDHSIMMEILAQIYVHPLFTISSITYKLWCTLQLRRQIQFPADTLLLFLLYPFLLCGHSS